VKPSKNVSSSKPSPSARRTRLALAIAFTLTAIACAGRSGEEAVPDRPTEVVDGGAERAVDAGAGRDADVVADGASDGSLDATADTGLDATADAGLDDCREDAWPPCVTTTPAELSFELFDVVGARFWIELDAAQQRAMNVRLPVSNCGPGGCQTLENTPRFPGDFYSLPDDGEPTPLGVDDGATTFAHRLIVRVPGVGGADFGKVEVRNVGTSTRRPMVRDGLPSLRFDADEFQEDLRVGGVEHFRLNNGIVGSLLREHVAGQVFRALGYPALRTSFAFLGSSVHGEGVWIPMLLSETYKRGFCDANADALGGGCRGLWKFSGDIGSTGNTPFADPSCELGECDGIAVAALGDALRQAPAGPGLVEALESFLDWELFHRFQCIGFAVGTVDDTLRNFGNNTVLAQRADDGRFLFLPFSIDISGPRGPGWPSTGTDTLLRGNVELMRSCQADPTCWRDTLDTCRAVVRELRALRPETLVEDALETLRAAGMIRPGDEALGAELRAWYAARPDALDVALEAEAR
jgi:hypothetical protein